MRRPDQQQTTLAGLPPFIQRTANRPMNGLVHFPAHVFVDCLTHEDTADLAHPKFRKAAVTRVTLRRCGTWTFRVRCPWCGRMHGHGGGTGPLPYFGHRTADCDALGGYLLDPRGA